MTGTGVHGGEADLAQPSPFETLENNSGVLAMQKVEASAHGGDNFREIRDRNGDPLFRRKMPITVDDIWLG